MGLAALNGDGVDVHIHGAEIDGAEGCQVLVDAGANGVVVVLLFLAGDAEAAEGSKSCNGEDLYCSIQGEDPARRVYGTCARFTLERILQKRNGNTTQIDRFAEPMLM